MDMKTLQSIPPWDWPEDAGKTFLDVLRDDRADASERLVAAGLAGDFTVINEDLVEVLLSILGDHDKPEDLRGKAAISLGPVLEFMYIEAFDDPDDIPITEETFNKIQKSLHTHYLDAEVPKQVRRKILEASVRAPRDWHQGPVRASYSSDDEAWRLTAVFGMRFIRGFDEQILEALDDKNPDIHYEAVLAAGNWEVDAAWRHIIKLLDPEETDRPLLFAAIEAAANIRPKQASEVLGHLTDSDDEDIAEAALEAMAMAKGIFFDE